MATLSKSRQVAVAIRDQIDALRYSESLTGISTKLARNALQVVAIRLANSWFSQTSPSSSRARGKWLDLALGRNTDAWRLENHEET